MNIVDKFKEFWARWDGEPAEPPRPTLEERINAQIKAMEHNVVAQDGVNNNILGMVSRHERALHKLERRNEQVDAHYVRTMATAFDEKHQAFELKIEGKMASHQTWMANMLKDIEEHCNQSQEVLRLEIDALKADCEATSENLRKALARLRAVGEGN